MTRDAALGSRTAGGAPSPRNSRTFPTHHDTDDPFGRARVVKLVLPSTGSYRLTTKLKPPKHKSVKHVADPELE